MRKGYIYLFNCYGSLHEGVYRGKLDKFHFWERLPFVGTLESNPILHEDCTSITKEVCKLTESLTYDEYIIERDKLLT